MSRTGRTTSLSFQGKGTEVDPETHPSLPHPWLGPDTVFFTGVPMERGRDPGVQGGPVVPDTTRDPGDLPDLGKSRSGPWEG